MRIAFLFLMFAFGLAPASKAQGTLQFNQALVLTAQSQASCPSCWTVPSGRVWKITGFSCNSTALPSLYINGLEGSGMLGSSFSTSSSAYWGPRYGQPSFPIWLSAGTSLGFANGTSSMNTIFYGIEFNIIP